MWRAMTLLTLALVACGSLGCETLATSPEALGSMRAMGATATEGLTSAALSGETLHTEDWTYLIVSVLGAGAAYFFGDRRGQRKGREVTGL